MLHPPCRVHEPQDLLCGPEEITAHSEPQIPCGKESPLEHGSVCGGSRPRISVSQPVQDSRGQQRLGNAVSFGSSAKAGKLGSWIFSLLIEQAAFWQQCSKAIRQRNKKYPNLLVVSSGLGEKK